MKNNQELIARRNSIGRTQKEMAEAVNMPLPTYKKYEQGIRAIPRDLGLLIGLGMADERAVAAELLDMMEQFGWDEDKQRRMARFIERPWEIEKKRRKAEV